MAPGLMEAVAAAGNMRQALKCDRASKGGAGIDGMSVQDLSGYLQVAWPQVRQSLLDGTCRLRLVKRGDTPKPGGGTRQLGILTVPDRLLQQALLQVLSPLYEPAFSPHSYGSRPRKSAVARPWRRKFLGYRIIVQREVRPTIAPASLERAKHKVRQLRTFTDGWVPDFRQFGSVRSFRALDEWIRRRVRCFIWKQSRKPRNRARELLKAGVCGYAAWGMAYDGPGLWRAAGSPPLHKALSNARLAEPGHHSLCERYEALAAA